MDGCLRYPSANNTPFHMVNRSNQLMNKTTKHWERNISRIESLMEKDDLSKFLTWDVIKYTMFMTIPP